jgi:hypothetical protein
LRDYRLRLTPILNAFLFFLLAAPLLTRAQARWSFAVHVRFCTVFRNRFPLRVLSRLIMRSHFTSRSDVLQACIGIATDLPVFRHPKKRPNDLSIVRLPYLTPNLFPVIVLKVFPC